MEKPLEIDLDESMDQLAALEEDPLQFLWAVSYSDLLMVLVSFFIVYFSFVESKEQNILEVISTSLQGARPAVQHSAVEAKSVPLSPELLEHIKKAFDQKATIERDASGASAIRFDLADNIFHPGQYELNENAKTDIDRLIEILKPHRNQVTLTFIGHADEEPVHRRAHSPVRSNMSLSSLRSTRGVEYAIERGVDPHYVWSEGFAEFGRNTRSLSVRIRERISE